MDYSKDVMALLKEHTTELHTQTEKLFFPDGGDFKTFTLPQYKNFIKSSFWFNKALEQAIEKYFNTEQKAQLEFESRKKAHLAKIDLEAFNEYNGDFVVKPIVIETFEEAFGLMYVSEGSTLGGTVIKRALEKLPEFEKINGYHYLGCYGNDLRNKWINFCQFGARNIISDKQKELAVKGGIIGFEALKNIHTQLSQLT